MLGLVAPVAHGAEAPPVLARVGPWPVVSGLIGFQGRLWLVNSVKGVNHNSADVYSYGPDDGAADPSLRYEHHLFSQDAGSPAVAGGLLYWPFEDARFSTAVGHFMVTDGGRWRFGVVPTVTPTFHVHSMAASAGRLVAATSAWRAGLQVSDDGGRSWRQVYDKPTPERQVTRIVELVALDELVLGYLIGRDLRQLVVLDGEDVAPLSGWPDGQAVRGLARLGNHVYGALVEAGGVAIWRTDGRSSERVTAPLADWPVVDLAADADGLWALTADASGGALWRSERGRRWQEVHRLEGGRPHDLTTWAGGVYVGGAGDDGRGILWGPRDTNPPPPIDPSPRLGRWVEGADGVDWRAAGERLARLLGDPASYAAGGELRSLIQDLALAAPPQDFFGQRLGDVMPNDEVSRIGGQVRLKAATLGRWLLLWGMSLAGSGRVPPELIEAPWTTLENRAEKYFDSPPAAMWAATIAGQRDAATIDALMARLERTDDPLWLRGDAVGALSALTGQRFGYDAPAWRDWWDRTRPGWAE
jgi:putative AlgH/UPF0301 family transcriptional regulator